MTATTVELRESMRRRLADDLLDARSRMPSRDLDAEDERQLARSLLTRALTEHSRDRIREGLHPLEEQAESELVAAVLADTFGTGALERYLADPTVTDVLVHGGDTVHVVHADGWRERVPGLASSDEELVEMVRTLAREAGARFDAAGVEANFALADGSRLFAAIGVSPRPIVVVRRHHLAELASLEDLQRAGMLDARLAGLLRALVLARQNVIVSGGTQAGKTTLCRALCHEIPSDEHVVTIEDTYELQLHRSPQRHPMVTAMLARPENTEGAGEVTLAQLTRMALRVSPDRVVVGEVRGAEVIPMLDAMSQGNDGSMGTVHASSSRAAPTRLAGYAIRTGQLRLDEALFLVATAVDFVVHVAKGADGRRRVASVREITAGGGDGLVISSSELFVATADELARPTGVPLGRERAEALHAIGYPGWQ
ncbi:MAG: Flp pilus assembly complex ATPase component TadA [Actinomycetota bacterium]|nr:Flp pilus assembly complex ATPase component TadA [Actinomycetota bacterium]